MLGLTKIILFKLLLVLKDHAVANVGPKKVQEI